MSPKVNFKESILQFHWMGHIVVHIQYCISDHQPYSLCGPVLRRIFGTKLCELGNYICIQL